MDLLFGFIGIYAVISLITYMIDTWMHKNIGRGLFPRGYWK